MSVPDLYDSIGRSYAERRRPDPRIAAQINDAIGAAQRVVNVGAGAGSYEPADRNVVAVEPSTVMIGQRQAGSAPVVRATAEALPFADEVFDAALAVLTVHHWSDKAGGLAEMRRVARKCVVLCFDLALEQQLWLVREYFPEIATLDYGRALSPEDIADNIRATRIDVVPVPWDCIDGFLGAYWRRPDAYLDVAVRASISGLAQLDQSIVDRGIARLQADLDSGDWSRRHADLLARDELDLGYRLVVSE